MRAVKIFFIFVIVVLFFALGLKAGGAILGQNINPLALVATTATDELEKKTEESPENVSVDEEVDVTKGGVKITAAGECAKKEIAKLTGQARAEREKRCAHKKGIIKWTDENGKEQACVRTEFEGSRDLVSSSVTRITICAGGPCAPVSLIKTQCSVEGNTDEILQNAVQTGNAQFLAQGTTEPVSLTATQNVSEPFNDVVFNAFSEPDGKDAFQQLQTYSAQQIISDAANGGEQNSGKGSVAVSGPQLPVGPTVQIAPTNVPGAVNQNPADGTGNGNLGKGATQTFPDGNPNANPAPQNFIEKSASVIGDFFKSLFGVTPNPVGVSQNPSGTGNVPGNGGTNPVATGSVNNPTATPVSNSTDIGSGNPFKDLIDTLFKPFNENSIFGNNNSVGQTNGVQGGVQGGVEGGNVGGTIGSTGTAFHPDGKPDGEVDENSPDASENGSDNGSENGTAEGKSEAQGNNPNGSITGEANANPNGNPNGVPNVTTNNNNSSIGNPNANANPNAPNGSVAEVKNGNETGVIALPEKPGRIRYLWNRLTNWADKNLCVICAANARQMTNREVQEAPYPFAQYHSEIDRKYGLPDGALRRTCKVESGAQCNPNAFNRASNATGQFQIIGSTWVEWCQASLRQSAAWCASNGNLRYNYQISSEATALRMQQRLRQHAALFQQSKINPILGLYLMHFNGDGNGTRYLQALGQNPNIPAASILINRDAVVRANPTIYLAAGATGMRYRTVGEVAQLFANKLQVPVFTDQPFVPGNTPAVGVVSVPTITHSFGDSLAQGIKTAGGLGGDALQNRTPGDVLQKIKEYIAANPGELNGKHVVLSTGISNAPNASQLPIIQEQINTLKAAVGANGSVTVIGAGTRADIAPFNEQLQKMANESGVKFQPLSNLATDKVHLANYKTFLDSISGPNAVVPTPNPNQVIPNPNPNQVIPNPNPNVSTGPVGYTAPIGQPQPGSTFPGSPVGGGVTNPGIGTQIQQPLPPQLTCMPVVISKPETEQVNVRFSCPYGTIQSSGFNASGSAGQTNVSLGSNSNGARFSAICINGGLQSAQVSCDVQVRRPVLALLSQPATTTPGMSVRLSWSGLNVKSCILDAPNAVPRPVETTGVFETGALQRSSIFKLMCSTQSGLSIESSTTVRVEGDTQPPLTPES